VAEGRFREDLLFRLNTVEIHLPALRERREDIPALANHFLAMYGRQYRSDVDGFDANALEAMLSHAWPGNVRELDHVIQRGVLMAKTNLVSAIGLGLQSRREAAPPMDEMSLEDVERALIRKSLERAGGSVSDAAKTLGLSRSAMYRRLQKHGL
jgi:DNA-binding NtrC family response regulator